jgi:hypothetical protein
VFNHSIMYLRSYALAFEERDDAHTMGKDYGIGGLLNRVMPKKAARDRS